jgi:hypothetical protein
MDYAPKPVKILKPSFWILKPSFALRANQVICFL